MGTTCCAACRRAGGKEALGEETDRSELRGGRRKDHAIFFLFVGRGACSVVNTAVPNAFCRPAGGREAAVCPRWPFLGYDDLQFFLSVVFPLFWDPATAYMKTM